MKTVPVSQVHRFSPPLASREMPPKIKSYKNLSIHVSSNMKHITLHMTRRFSVSKCRVILEISANSQQKHLCQILFFNKVAGATCNFIKKKTLAQVFSCEFCEISKNSFFYRRPLVAA